MKGDLYRQLNEMAMLLQFIRYSHYFSPASITEHNEMMHRLGDLHDRLREKVKEGRDTDLCDFNLPKGWNLLYGHAKDYPKSIKKWVTGQLYDILSERFPYLNPRDKELMKEHLAGETVLTLAYKYKETPEKVNEIIFKQFVAMWDMNQEKILSPVKQQPEPVEFIYIRKEAEGLLERMEAQIGLLDNRQERGRGRGM